MKNFRLLMLVLILTSFSALAAPQPSPPVKPAYPTSLTVSQGLVNRTLIVPNAACAHYTDTPDATGLRRIALAQPDGRGGLKPCVANGSYLQLSQTAGPLYPQWIYAAPPPVCAPMPGPVTITKDCAVTNPGTTGTWLQTATYGPASPQVPPDGCWVLGTPVPAVAPAGACNAVTPPAWAPAVNVSADPMIAKPARGVTFGNRYGTTSNRITDHAVDRPGVAFERNDYSRRQPVNLDGTRALVDCGNGFWCTYDVSDPVHARFVGVLAGPAGDAELQWSANDPDVLVYLGRNGDTTFRQVKVSTNVSTVLWDFTATVRAFWPGAVHCWTKSEGSPSADGRFWGLMCEDTSFNPLGFVVLDIVSKTVTWHANNSVRPDHVSMTPSGRWFERSGDDSLGTQFYGVVPSNLGQTRQGHHKSEHSDIGFCSSFDFYASVDYQTNLGDIFWVNLEDPTAARHVIGYVYGHPNPWFGTNYALHFSAKAFGKCGFLSSNYGVPPANIVWFDLTGPVNSPYGVGVNYAIDQNYFDEVQAAIARDGKSFYYNDTFGGPSQSGDVYRGTMPNGQ